MTRQRSFKRLVRARMAKTGEHYATARRMLLAAGEVAPGTTTTAGAGTVDAAVLVAPDARIRERSGRGWEEWFDLLDEWGAEAMSHRDIARKVAAELGIQPLAWPAQAVTTSYERARGLRAVGERVDGWAVTASRTVAVPVERLFAAVTDEAIRAQWLPDGELKARTATAPKTAHFDWGSDGSRVHVTITPRGDDRGTVTVEHARLAGDDDAAARKAYWRAALLRLKALLESA